TNWPRKSARLWGVPAASGRVKSGAGVFSLSIGDHPLKMAYCGTLRIQHFRMGYKVDDAAGPPRYTVPGRRAPGRSGARRNKVQGKRNKEPERRNHTLWRLGKRT